MIYVMIADGFEEIEALEPVDIMRRAGLSVQTVGVSGRSVRGAHGITVEADIGFDEVKPELTEVIVLPGGPGHELLDASNEVHYMINSAHARGVYIAAICAAPSVIGKKGLLDGKHAVVAHGGLDLLPGDGPAAELQLDKAVARRPSVAGHGNDVSAGNLHGKALEGIVGRGGPGRGALGGRGGLASGKAQPGSCGNDGHCAGNEGASCQVHA